MDSTERDRERHEQEAAFADLVRAHESRLWQAIVPIAGPDAANDAVAHALIVAWRQWPRVRAMDNPVGYLYRIAANEARPRRRRRPAAFDRSDDGRLPDVEPKLRAALLALSEQQRAVVFLVVAWDWPHGEVAELLGITTSTVSSHLLRGMHRLRTEFEVEIDV